MKFLLDMGISPALAEELRSRGFEATHLEEIGEGRLPDPQILARARAGGHVLVTHDGPRIGNPHPLPADPLRRSTLILPPEPVAERLRHTRP